MRVRELGKGVSHGKSMMVWLLSEYDCMVVNVVTDQLHTVINRNV